MATPRPAEFDEPLRRTVRLTSIDAYNRLKSSGALSRKRWHVYELIYEYGPGTSAEILEHWIRFHPEGVLTQSRARFTELRDLGLVHELGTVVCRMTGHSAILWDVTDRQEPALMVRKVTPTNWRRLAAELLEVHAELVDREGDLMDLARLRELQRKAEGLRK